MSDLHRERTPEICRGSSSKIQLNTDQHMHGSKLGKVPPEKLRFHISSAHLGSTIVTSARQENFKIHDIMSGEYRRILPQK